MANVSEPERGRLARLVASSIKTMGVTEVARITELSTTSLRKYSTKGLEPGVRAATVAAIRRLEPVKKKTARAVESEPTTPELLEQLRRITEALEERLRDREDPEDGPGAQKLRAGRGDTPGTGTPDTKRQA